MNDEQKQIRSYLQAQGAKLAPPRIIEKVRAAMADLRAAAEAVPAARFSDRPAPDEWSADEVMAHVVEAGRHFGDAIRAAIEGRLVGPRARDERGAGGHTAEQWSAILESDRTALFARVLAAAPTARLDAMIDHGAFGALNWRETLLFLRLHDLDHAAQLQKIAAAHQSAGGAA